MKFDVLNFGWTHCAVGHLKINTVDLEPVRTALKARLKQLIKVKETCDTEDAD